MKLGESSDFQDLKKQLENLRNSFTDDKCNNCGQIVNWSEKQFKKNCSKCGQVMIRSTKIPQQPTKCYLCFDTGYVSYKCQIDGFPYTYGGACPECEAGQNIKNDHIPWVQDTVYAPPIASIRRYNQKLCGLKEAP